MANYPVNKIRNVCLMGHGGDGKTSLVESLLNIAGVTDRVGKIADGNYGLQAVGMFALPKSNASIAADKLNNVSIAD